MPVEISYYKGNNYFAVDNRKYGTKNGKKNLLYSNGRIRV